MRPFEDQHLPLHRITSCSDWRAASSESPETMLKHADEKWVALELKKATGLTLWVVYPALGKLEQSGQVNSGWENLEAHGVKRQPRRLVGTGTV